MKIEHSTRTKRMDPSSTRPAFIFLRPRPTAPSRRLPLLLDDDVVVGRPDHLEQPVPPVVQQQQQMGLTLPADTSYLVVEADLPSCLYLPVLQETNSGTTSLPSAVFPTLKRHRDHSLDDDPEAELPAQHKRLSQSFVGTDARPILDDNQRKRGYDLAGSLWLAGSWPAGCYQTPKCQRRIQAVDWVSSPPWLLPRVVTPTHYELADYRQPEDDGRTRATTTTTTTTTAGRRRVNLPLLPTSS
jgi:hypothetical protein